MDSSRSWADAVAIAEGRVVFVGSAAGAGRFITPATRIVDVSGKMVLPGFHDAHVHPVSGGLELGQCNLNGIEKPADVLAAIRDCCAKRPDASWIVGGGWDLPLFPNANPTREALDRVVSDKPAFLTAADGHSAWVNSRALDVAGITKDTSDPQGGRIERDPKTGAPSGTLRESAMELVSRHLPKTSDAERLEGLRRALEMANGFGITSLLEADADEAKLDAYNELDRRGELTARVVAAQHFDPSAGESQVATLVARRGHYSKGRLSAEAVKIFADGVIEAQTAALLEPYLDNPGDRGEPNLEPDAFKRIVTRLDREDFQVHVHAIGDRAVRLALDAFEAAQKSNGRRDARHAIAHLELIDPEDIPRFRTLGVVADFQPFWAWRDPYIRDLTEPRLGPKRSRWLYPIGSVVRSGAVLAAGSDWSVSSMNPLDAIQVALTRRGLEDAKGSSWIPEERADLITMLAAYTNGGAYALGQEKETGSIEVGRSADLIVLDHNLFATPVEEIHRVKVLLTFLEGKEVYRAPSF